MIVGIPMEIKNNENRVSGTPAGVEMLVKAGHTVVVQKDAGMGSGFTDAEYVAVGAKILDTIEAVYAEADLIWKVKEPLAEEYPLFKEGQLLFTYLHLAPAPELTKALLDKKVTGIAYETVQTADRKLPLLSPMSEVAGRMSIQVGAEFLMKHHGGSGVLIGGVPGVKPAKVVVVGGGVAGTNAAKMALGMHADVSIIELGAERLRYLDDLFGGAVRTLKSNSYNIANEIKDADIVIGSVLIPGAKAPKLVTEEMVKTMKPGSVCVDIAIDQGGAIETSPGATTHDNPVRIIHDVVHYSVANMPGAFARTSTITLENNTAPYCVQLANKGWKQACIDRPELAKGLNVCDGKVTFKPVADALGYDYVAADTFLK